MNTLALFAGQGAQYVGMGKDLFEDKEVASYFKTASSILGYDLAELCFNGPIESITSSDHCQPAIFVVSAACFRAFKTTYPTIQIDGFAGLSLGEWTALWAAGVIDFENTVRILEARGRFMQDACNEKPSSMVSILSLPIETVEKIASESDTHISNINSQAQINLAGTKENVEKAEKLAKEAGGKAIILNVAGAFHSPFMNSAKERLSSLLDTIPFNSPAMPVFSNYAGALHSSDPAKIKEAMLSQITGTVRWYDCMVNSGATKFIEFGPGKVLSGLAKRMNKAHTALSIQDAASIAAFQTSPFFA